MEKTVIYEMKALYRDNLRVMGYRFGKGEDTACIVGAIRGNEIQQLYTCSIIVKMLKNLEEAGKIADGKSIMVIPSTNTYSMNVEKRFWPTDNTDINRMFPGYSLGETTQRIANGIFEKIKNFKYGIQFASFYIPGDFIPHVRMMKTGYEDTSMAMDFGLPYVVLREPRPYDTTTLNYNWQVWGCDAFSLYAGSTEHINEEDAMKSAKAVFRFLTKRGVIEYEDYDGEMSDIILESELHPVKNNVQGILKRYKAVGDRAECNELIAEIFDPYENEVKEQIRANRAGKIFYVYEKPLINSNSVIYKML